MVARLSAALALATVIAVGAATPAVALPGDLDPSFGPPTGLVFPPNGQSVDDLAVEPGSGRVLAALDTPTVAGNNAVFGVARYNADGSLDAAGWNSGGAQPGVATLDIFDGSFEGAGALALQADGKVVVAGVSENRLALVRFHADGLPDTTFNDSDAATPPGSVVTNLPATALENLTGVAVQPADQKIVVTGYAQPGPDVSHIVFARYNTGGGLDTAGFNDADASTPAGTVKLDVAALSEEKSSDLAVDGAGRIVVSGYGEVAGTSRWAVARLTAAGLVDSGYGDGGTGVKVFNLGAPALDDLATKLTLDADGGAVVTGAADAIVSSSADTGLARLTSAGALDPSFGNGGTAVVSLAPYDYMAWVGRQPDGNLVVTGLAGQSGSSTDVALARFDAVGALDPGFGSGGKATYSASPGVDLAAAGALQADGRILVGGAGLFGSSSVPLLARFFGGEPGTAGGAGGPGDTSLGTQPGLDARPTLRSVSMSRRVFRVARRGSPLASARRRPKAGTEFRFSLSERAMVRIAFERRAAGRRVGRRCRPPARRLRSRRRCTRQVPAGSLSRALGAGRQRVPFSGRIGRRGLRPAPYRATLVAIDGTGNRSDPKRIGFRIVR